jgi:hypothetical protein
MSGMGDYMERLEDLFDRWYVRPLKSLQQIPNGDGGFIALATSCFLYERYARAVITASGAQADKKAIIKQFSADFDVNEEVAGVFWDVIRNGLAHGAMPKQQEHGQSALPKWAFRRDFPAVDLVEWEGERVLRVQPWLVMDKVISLWRQNLRLLGKSNGFPWATIVQLPF